MISRGTFKSLGEPLGSLIGRQACCHEFIPLHWLAALKVHAQVLNLVRLALELAGLGCHFEHLELDLVHQRLHLVQVGESLEGLLEFIAAHHVSFEALAEVGPRGACFLLTLVKEGLEDEQGWDAHENRGVPALHEFVKGGHLGAGLL